MSTTCHQASLLTGEPSHTPGERPHPHSPLLTHLAHPHPPLSARPIPVTVHGSILGPWSTRPKWAPTTASFLAVAQNEGKAILKMTRKLALPPLPRVLFSLFSNLLAARCQSRLVRSYSTPTFRCHSLLDLLLFALNCHLWLSLLPSSPSRANRSKTYRRGT
jgi:hypothetical protein